MAANYMIAFIILIAALLISGCSVAPEEYQAWQVVGESAAKSAAETGKSTISCSAACEITLGSDTAVANAVTAWAATKPTGQNDTIEAVTGSVAKIVGIGLVAHSVEEIVKNSGTRNYQAGGDISTNDSTSLSHNEIGQDVINGDRNKADSGGGTLGDATATPTVVNQPTPTVVNQPPPVIVTQPPPIIVDPVVVQPEVIIVPEQPAPPAV